ncbi:chemotaxis protein CheW [Marinibaculum pumilum]|uniref:Chemotaxis protein CheW n=1 Tax=Marinibaculum pumilum TaxID=1766165 RepID=A0ABV7KU14_9PROT
MDVLEKEASGRHREAASETGREFVMFHVGQEAFAVPLGQVKEIIRMPALTRLPLAPPAVEGIANLRGGVLPVIGLRRVFGFGDSAHDEATRVVVLDIGRAAGIVVDSMSAVRAVDEERIEDASRISSSVDSDLLTGVIKDVADKDGTKRMVMVLDIERLVARECAVRGVDAAAGAAATVTEMLAQSAEVRGGQAEVIRQFVSFEVDGQEYALPIEDVQEIVHAPSDIARVPNAPSSVVGMVTMRNRVLPILSLRELFGLEPKPIGEDDRVVVVSPAATGHSVTVGVVTDTVKEVLRIGSSVIDPMPAMLSAQHNMEELTAVCRLNDGKRLVSIISAEKMFDRSAMRQAIASVSEHDDRAENGSEEAIDMQDDRNGAVVEEEQLVVFKLADEEYGVAIDAVQEIVRVPESLTRVPNTPAFIEGVINLRGTVIPLVDQRRRFGLPGLERNERQRIVVFTVRGIRTGFIVDSVTEVRRIARSAIGPAPEISEAQQKLIRRVANLEAQKRMILLLDTDQLLDTKEVRQLEKAA